MENKIITKDYEALALENKMITKDYEALVLKFEKITKVGARGLSMIMC